MNTTLVGGEAVDKSIPFTTVTDLTGMEHKIIDFDKYEYPHEGLVMFEFTKKGERNIYPNVSVANTRDKRTGVNIGILVDISSTSKKPKFLEITLGGETTFDLSVADQRKKAIVVSNSSICIGSPNLSPMVQQHLIREHDLEKANMEEIKRVNDMERAIQIAKGLAGEKLFNVARNLGIMVENVSVTTVTAEVLKRAYKNPKEFLSVMDNPNLERITVLKRCLSTSTIMHEPLTGYTYLGRPLGHNEPEVIEFFIKNPDIFTTLDFTSRDKISHKEKAEHVKKINITSPEVEAYKKKIEELEKKLSEKTALDIKSDNPELVKELEVSLEKARQYKIRPLHVYTPTRDSIDKLNLKIREAGG